MRKNFGAKPYLYPQPVMIIGTYDENGNANAMNAAWGGIVGMDKIIIDLSSHKTTDNLMRSKGFYGKYSRYRAYDGMRLCRYSVGENRKR